MDSVVVDTDVISFWHKDDSRFAYYRPHLIGKLLIISITTLAELEEWAILRRWGTERRKSMERHLQRFYLCPTDQILCRLWAEVRESSRRAGRIISPSDAWIAATALACNASLVTHNAVDFQGVSGLPIISSALK